MACHTLRPGHRDLGLGTATTPTSPATPAMPHPRIHVLLDVMVTLAVQPRLAEARPEPDTPAQLRATVAKHLANNAQASKPLSTREPLELHPTRGCDQTRECKDGAEEGLEKRKKRESFTFTLLDAYNVAINMDTRKREGRPTQGTPPAEVPAPPSDGPSSPSPTKASPAPPTLEGTAKEEPGITSWAVAR
ncbi:unnamed protein product [Gadus morhua 'NCC']